MTHTIFAKLKCSLPRLSLTVRNQPRLTACRQRHLRLVVRERDIEPRIVHRKRRLHPDTTCPVESQLTRMLLLEFGAIHSSVSQTSDEHRVPH